MKVSKVLFITLSNIGDAILTLPALDYLRQNFPDARFTVLSSPRPSVIFSDNPLISKLIIYDKHAQLKDKVKLFFELKKERFDLIADFRNSLFGLFLPASYKTPLFLNIPSNIKHMKNRHLFKVKSQKAKGKSDDFSEAPKTSINICPVDETYIKNILNDNGIKDTDKLIVIASGARSHVKRWAQEKFSALIDALAADPKLKMVLVGDKEDLPVNKRIVSLCRNQVLDLTGKTDLARLAGLLKRSALLITNDSASLHLASYLNTPVVAIFGPTDELKYGPWSDRFRIVKKEVFCRPCMRAQCRFGTLDCMQMIRVGDVLKQVEDIMGVRCQVSGVRPKNDFKRILIVRTDRIGDVLLSTPAIRALRDSYPSAYIAMMTGPYAKEAVEGNPYLDEVIVYDKDHKHKSWMRSLKFSRNLKKKKFDLAVILHPSNRVHLVTFLAGIPRRIGYRRKMGFLLTDRIRHEKQSGEKHELEYNLDLLRHLGIPAQDKGLFMPIKEESEAWAQEFLGQQGIGKKDKLIAIHPAASCPSKIWPGERFARTADLLAQKYGFKILVFSGPKDISLANNVAEQMNSQAINLAGKTSVTQLASLLKRCTLFISNDSGPVHIASALGVPVISIFGRNQKGLSPRRWGPVGEKDKVLHKEVGCVVCLAHNCDKGFACLKAISVEDVLAAADEILQS
ncbi:MAG: lipopolysaccharide heptosyltransferase II [Candidatus Omnitrophica bacterium]|nr:lipopolysaccharide heptosyltransferase II [Candidatus Omnitrophota bacterium]